MIEAIDLGIVGLTNIERLGSGGNAVVYRARQDELDRMVVVKVLLNVDADATRRRFDRERKAMGRLSQATGIAPLYGSGFTPTGKPYLLMPYYEQGSLQDRLDQAGALDPERVRSIGVTIARAVQTAHENGVLHRDVKPANILIRRSGDADVADFGIAHLTDDVLGTSQALTMTPLYTAPEAFDGVKSSAASDVYSLGATLFALLNGHPAHGDRDATVPILSLMRRINEDPLPALPPTVPPGLARVVAKAMNKQVADRYGTAGELAAALAAADMSVPRVQRSKLRSSKPSRGVILAVLAVVLAAIVGVVVAVLTAGRSDSTASPATATAAPQATTESTVEPTVDETAPFDMSVARTAARQGLVRLEAFSCAGADVATGVLLSDGVIVTTSNVLANPWWIQVIRNGESHRAVVEANNSQPGFGFVQVENAETFEELSRASVSEGDQVALVGIDGSPALAVVGASTPANPIPELTLVDSGAGNAIESVDIAVTSQGEAVGFAAVGPGSIVLITPDSYNAGPRSEADYSCDTSEPDLAAGSSESAVSPEISELLTMQHLSNAYARKNWDLVRVLEPSQVGTTNAALAAEYQGFRQGYLFPIARTIDGDGLSRWRLGVVGHETWNGVDMTTLECVTWLINPVSEAITQTATDKITVHGRDGDATQQTGFRNPGSSRDAISANCTADGG